MERNDKALNIKLPNTLYSALQATAERKHVSLAALVRMLCSEGLERTGYVMPTDATPVQQKKPAEQVGDKSIDEIWDSLHGEVVEGW